tara:strand:+ start:1762 stop:1965 length:204 start_codon:yes stop_codon:yes gene_type:complete
MQSFDSGLDITEPLFNSMGRFVGQSRQDDVQVLSGDRGKDDPVTAHALEVFAGEAFKYVVGRLYFFT